MPFKIPNATLQHGLMLAPMAGFTDRAMRLMATKFGAEYTTTEMISAKAVVYRDKKTYSLAKIESDEGNTALQLFGKEPGIIAEAAGLLSETDLSDIVSRQCKLPSGIDINMGCPVNKIYQNGEGSALMKSPDLIYKILSATKKAIKLPLSAKLRLGIDQDHINIMECAIAAEEAGANYITIHGRTRAQMYAGNVDRKIPLIVKNRLHIPVVFSGDIVNYQTAELTFEETLCDGIMIGRAAIGNPFIFSEIRAALSGESYTPPSLEDRKSAALMQLTLACLDKGESTAVREARGCLAHYFKGYSGAARLRGEINSAETKEEIVALINAITLDKNTI